MTEEKKKEHDLKYELYQLRQRVDKLEQVNLECRKCINTMDSTIVMQFQLINALCDLSSGMAEDIVKINTMMKEDKDANH